MKKRICFFSSKSFVLIAVIAMFLIGGVSVSNAFDIPTGKEELKIRWDNTIKYNLGIRAKSADVELLSSVNYDDGDRNFRSGGIVTNRLDILSEFDFVYKEDFGFRISASGWYDQRYRDPMDNTSVATSNTLDENGNQTLGFSQRVKDYYKGPYGEILDAFVFGRFDLGPVPLSVKLGRHTQYWGESMLGFINAISYSQFPVDFAKALGVPGSEVKELFRPRAALSLQAQLTNTLGLQFQQFLQFEPARIPDSGTYLGAVDIYQKGADAIITPYGVWRHDSDIEPDGYKDFGIALNWKPDFMQPLQGKFGFFFRNFTDQMPQAYLDVVGQNYFLVYPDNVKLYGASLGFAVFGTSIGVEYSFRRDMPLNSDTIISLGTRPDKGDTAGARGDVHVATLNFMKMFGPTPVSDAGTGILEFTYCNVQHVSQGDNVYKGADSWLTIDRVTREALGVAISYTPTWFAVLPQLDLSLPLSYSRGLLGNSALNGGDAEGQGSAMVGVSADYKQKYTFTIAYNTYYGHHDYAAGDIKVKGGLPALLYDRDWVSFTFKTNF